MLKLLRIKIFALLILKSVVCQSTNSSQVNCSEPHNDDYCKSKGYNVNFPDPANLPLQVDIYFRIFVR